LLKHLAEIEKDDKKYSGTKLMNLSLKVARQGPTTRLKEWKISSRRKSAGWSCHHLHISFTWSSSTLVDVLRKNKGNKWMWSLL